MSLRGSFFMKIYSHGVLIWCYLLVNYLSVFPFQPEEIEIQMGRADNRRKNVYNTQD